MKTKFTTLFLLLTITLSHAQVSFQHVTSPINTSGAMTLLDHPQLNGNPNAVVFVAPLWQQVGDVNPAYSVGTRYQNGRWYIYQQNQYAMPSTTSPRLRFNVLAYPSPTAGVLVHRVTAGNRSGHITTLDHPQLNNNPGAALLVTQRFGAYNNHEVGVWYNGNRWKIFNQDLAEMPSSAQFNVLIMANRSAPGLSGAVSFSHIHNVTTQLGSPNVGYSVINQPTINRQANFRLFMTPQFIGQYNPHPVNIWYDRPDDGYSAYRDGFWMVFNSYNQPMATGLMMNVLAVPTNMSTTIGTVVRRETWYPGIETLLKTARVRLNNFTSQKHQFRSQGEMAYYRPDDNWMEFSPNNAPLRLPIADIPMIEAGPENRCKTYINDWNTSAVTLTPADGQLILSLNFENEGVEIVTDCYNNGCCEWNPFCPSIGCPDFELNNARIDIIIKPFIRSGRLTYDADVAFSVNVQELGGDPCQGNFWAFLCDWGIIPRVNDRENIVRRTVEREMKQKLTESQPLRLAIETALNQAIPVGGATQIQLLANGDIVLR
jgi:hypothetical protein